MYEHPSLFDMMIAEVPDLKDFTIGKSDKKQGKNSM
jgi:hypothetical protein